MKLGLAVIAIIIFCVSIVIFIHVSDQHKIEKWCNENKEIPVSIHSSFTGWGTPFKYKLKNERIYIAEMSDGKTFYFRFGHLFQDMNVEQ
jgi:hypothetical protein